MALREEIQDLLASFNTPAEIGERIASAYEEIGRTKVAPGLEVGERAPDFVLPDFEGNAVRLADHLARGPVVMTFFRGAWCPICNLQVAAFARAIDEITAAGGSLLAVHPDSQTFEQAPDVGFPILRDGDQSVIRNYRLQFEIPPDIQRLYTGTFGLDLSARTADGSWNLPVPGTFILDGEGIVRQRHVTADFTERMEPEEVVAALAAIG